MRRAQTTLFIIIATIILMGGIVFIIAQGMGDDTETTTVTHPFDVTPVRTYVDSCLQQAIAEAAHETASQGGYYSPPPGSLSYFDTYIPYYYGEGSSGRTNLPDRSTLEESLSEWIGPALVRCIDDFKGFDTSFDAGMQQSNPDITTILSNQSIIAEARMTVTIRKGGSRTEISRFRSRIDSPLGEMYHTAKDITGTIGTDEGLCISCMRETTNDTGTHLDLYSLANNTFLLSVMKDDLRYRFAARKDITPGQSDSVTIHDIDGQSAFAGYPFHLDIEAQGEDLTFSDNTYLFDIDPATGDIRFTPDMDDIGTHLIKVSAEDSDGNSDEERFFLTINFSTTHPTLDPLGHVVAQAGQRFTYDVNATYDENVSLYFSAETDLFNITARSGVINFTPTQNDTGEHAINISAITDEGGFDSDILTLIIV